ncbi:MAG: hypothetical protein KatS3mg028_0380 [Bacteroidia bacterium]|nr:MAG: hypothetical protein KatS3mg028_0380 [Bacteroidia bacterium]
MRYFGFIYLFLLVFYLSAQDKYIKKFGFKKDNRDIPISMTQFHNSLFVSGRTQKIYSGIELFMINKIDSSGNMIISKSIGKDDERNTDISNINDEIILVGSSNYYVNAYGIDGIVSKLDTNLNIIWFKSIGGKQVEDQNRHFIETLNNGSILGIIGTNSFGLGYPPGFRSDIYVYHLDSNGYFLWSKTIGTIGADYGMDIKLLPDSSILIVGATQNTDTLLPSTYPFMFKLNKDSTLGYSQILYPVYGFLNKMIVYDNKIFVLGMREYRLPSSCYKRYGIVLMEIDALGKIKNLKSFIPNNACYSIHGNNFFIDKNKNILITGRYYFGDKYDGISKRYYAVFDTSFNLLESYVYDTISNFNEMFDGVYDTYYYDSNDKNLLMMSSITTGTSSPSFLNAKLLIVKTDSNLMSCENKYPLNLIEDTITYTIVPTGSITSINQGTVLSWTPTVIEGGVDSTICFCPALPVSVQTTSGELFCQRFGHLSAFSCAKRQLCLPMVSACV